MPDESSRVTLYEAHRYYMEPAAGDPHLRVPRPGQTYTHAGRQVEAVCQVSMLGWHYDVRFAGDEGSEYLDGWATLQYTGPSLEPLAPYNQDLPEATAWDRAIAHLSQTIDAYTQLVGAPQANPLFGLAHLHALKLRLATGERTRELYDAIMETR